MARYDQIFPVQPVPPLASAPWQWVGPGVFQRLDQVWPSACLGCRTETHFGADLAMGVRFESTTGSLAGIENLPFVQVCCSEDCRRKLTRVYREWLEEADRLASFQCFAVYTDRKLRPRGDAAAWAV